MPPKKCIFKTYACHEEEEMVVVEEEQLEAQVKKKPTRRGGRKHNQGAKNDRAELVGPEEQQQAGRLQGITGLEPRHPVDPPSLWLGPEGQTESTAGNAMRGQCDAGRASSSWEAQESESAKDWRLRQEKSPLQFPSDKGREI